MPQNVITVGLWTCTVIKNERIVERRYAVHSNGTILTRVDTCDLHRTIESFTGEGWLRYMPRNKTTDVKQILQLADEDLSAKGYKRLI